MAHHRTKALYGTFEVPSQSGMNAKILKHKGEKKAKEVSLFLCALLMTAMGPVQDLKLDMQLRRGFSILYILHNLLACSFGESCKKNDRQIHVSHLWCVCCRVKCESGVTPYWRARAPNPEFHGTTTVNDF